VKTHQQESIQVDEGASSHKAKSAMGPTKFSNGQPTIDHNLMIRNYNTPSGLRSYVFEANYTSGLRVYDINDLNNAFEVGYVDSYGFNNGMSFNGAWGVYSLLPSGMILLADMQAGLLVIDPSAVVPEECDLASAPASEPVLFPRNRYLAMTPGSAGVQTAIRIRMADLPPPFESFEGTDMWVDRPESVVVCEKDEGATTLQRLQPAELQSWLKAYSLGELWNSGQIGGRRI
jgi:hypothetical protein